MRAIRRRTVSRVFLFCFIFGLGASWADSYGLAPKPHILFILADDLGWQDVSFHGGEIRTPHIDSIASSGARLEQFYVQPVCSPTRAALMTGRYPMRYGLQVGVVRPWAQYGLPLEERLLSQSLKGAGYSTAITGKWHLGHFQRAYLPTQRGFDHQYGHYNGALDYFTHIRDGGFDWHRDDHALHAEGYSTFLIAEEAVRIVTDHDPGRPLFLYVPFNAVHAPLQVPEKYTKPYGHLKTRRRTYAGMVAAMDEAIGRILDAFKKKGLRRNTLVIFASDNGGPNPGIVTSNGPFRAGKGTLYEGGTRVAACASWEGHIPAGSVVNQPLHMVDWYPTLLTLAGVSLDQPLPLDGKDIWPSIALGVPSPHDEILLNTTPGSGAIRVGDWKLVINGKQGGANPEVKVAATKTVELFNLAQDPYEKTNLAVSNSAKLKELLSRYAVLAAQAVPPKSAPKGKGFESPKVWGEID